MTKEEFISKNKELRDKITCLTAELKQLEQDFIDSNFDKSLLGKKVNCYRMEWNRKNGKNEYRYVGIGFVSGVNIDRWDNQLIYEINAIKSNGTMSLQSAGYWRISKVEPIE